MNYSEFKDILIEPMYHTEEGLEFIPNPRDDVFIRNQCEMRNFKMAFAIHCIDGATIYAIFNNTNWTINYDLYMYLSSIKNIKKDLYELLIEGTFDIGIARMGSYHVIREITSYDNDVNNEIRMHYSTMRNTEGNIAWRYINYGSDVFQEFVEKNLIKL